MDCFLVIPCFRESARLPAFLEELCGELCKSDFSIRIQIVDDGSGAEEVERLRRVVGKCRDRFPFVEEVYAKRANGGKGAAIRDGFALAPDAARVLGFVDADGAVGARETLRVVELAMKERGAFLLAGSRQAAGARVQRSSIRRLIARGFAWLVARSYDIEIMDTQCGCKFLQGQWYRDNGVGFRENRFGWDLELILRAMANGCQVREIGVEWKEVSGSRLSFGDIARLGWSVWRRRIGE